MTLNQGGVVLALTEEPGGDTFGLPESPPIRSLADRRFRSVEVLENGRPRPLVAGTAVDLTRGSATILLVARTGEDAGAGLSRPSSARR